MLGTKRVACVIPARLKSSRFPQKMLSFLKGKPMLQWIWEKARQMPEFDEVLIAVDSKEVAKLVEEFGGRWMMTSEQCASGTDRLIEVMQSQCLNADVWVNWQGDEPLITHSMIQSLLQTCATDTCDVWTLKKRMSSTENALNPHCVKVVCDAQGEALYFSRSPIPFYRDIVHAEDKFYFKHVGLYAYTRTALELIARMPACELEQAEQLEQLRFLHHRLRVRVHETDCEVQGIDLPEHLAVLERSWDAPMG